MRQDDKNILLVEYPLARHCERLALRSGRQAAHRPSGYTGSKRTLGGSPLSGGSLLVDRNDEVRFTLGCNAQLKLAVNWLPQTGGAWTEFNMSGFREGSMEPHLFSADAPAAASP